MTRLTEKDDNGNIIVKKNTVDFPCYIGDTVYEPRKSRGFIQEYTIISIEIFRTGTILFHWELKDGQGIYSNVCGFYNYEIGKKVFLTREEAEAVMAKED